MRIEPMLRWLEAYINKTSRKELETFYGVGSKIKLKNVSESVKDKIFLFEATVIFGDKIDETFLEKDFAHIMICDAIDALRVLPEDSNIKTLITWDS